MGRNTLYNRNHYLSFESIACAWMEYSVILACTRELGIGLHGRIPWRLSSDMKLFRQVTTGDSNKNVVIMGRKTWHSLPTSVRPLPNRLNIVVSQSIPAAYSVTKEQSYLVVPSLDAALKKAAEHTSVTGGETFALLLHSGFFSNDNYCFLRKLN